MEKLDLKLFKISSQQINFLLFIILTCAVVIIHSIILEPAIYLAPHGDDWKVRVWYKLWGDKFLTSFFEVIKTFNLGVTYQIYHLWFLEKIFGFNPEAFIKANIFLKSIAALSIFPLTLMVFKNRLLSIIAVLLFTISYSTTGSLLWIITGGDYLAFAFMNLFLIVYYHVITKSLTNIRWLSLLSLSLIFALFLSPMRLYPLLSIPFLTEVVILTKKGKAKNIKQNLKRLVAAYWFFILFILKPSELVFTIERIFNFLTNVLPEHLDRILVPFQGIGVLLLHPSQTSKLPLSLNLNSFEDFFISSVLNTYILALTTFLVSIFIFGKQKIVIVISLLIFLAQFLCYVIYLQNPQNSIINDLPTFKNIILGIYLVLLSFYFFLHWYTQKVSNLLLLALWVGPLITLLFNLLTVMLGDINLVYQTTDRYLVIPSFGIILFISSLLAISISKSFKTNYIVLKLFFILFLVVYFFITYKISSQEVMSNFESKIKSGRDSRAEKTIHHDISQNLDLYNFNPDKPVFIYFETNNNDPKNARYLYEALTGSNLIHWFILEKTDLNNGCIEYIVNDKKTLQSILSEKDGKRGLIYFGSCLDKGVQRSDFFAYHNKKNVFYEPSNIFAFKFDNKKVSDFRKELLEELNLIDKESF